MKDTTRNRIGLLCFLPLILFTAWGVVYTIILRRQIENREMDDHVELVSRTFQAYGPLFLLLALACIVSAIVLIRLMMHVIRQRNLNNAQKLLWIIFMVAFGAFAFPLYWYWKIRGHHGDDRYDSHPGSHTHKGDGLIGDPSLSS